ncbi:MAG: hypothetical protein KJ915_04290 [Candidatus Omnitrophica bacterium]|nr:hypothetical protein [Candidatus Omnitrophota bacterium]
MSEFEYKSNKERSRPQFKKHASSDRHQEETDLPTMVKKMQQQLVFLERKIDLLLGQSSVRPPRSEGYAGSFGSGKRDDSFGERSSYKGSKSFAPRGGSRDSKPFVSRSGSRDSKPGEKSGFKGKKSFPSKKRGRS